jgi:hypothetical protein
MTLTPVTAAFQVNTTTTGDQINPRVQRLGNGNWVGCLRVDADRG